MHQFTDLKEGITKMITDNQINNIERQKRAEQELEENPEDDLASIRGMGF